MHDNFTGSVSSLSFNFSFEKFISTGSDGSIFVYSVHAKGKCFQLRTKSVSFSFGDCESIEDVEGDKILAIEDEKRVSIASEKTLRANKRRSEMIEVVNQLKSEYEFIKEQNSRLPAAMQLAAADFRIGGRIDAEVNAEVADMEKKFVEERQKSLGKIERFRSRMQTIMLNKWSMPLHGIRFVFCISLSIFSIYVCGY